MHGDTLAPVLLVLIVILAAAKLFGALFERLGQPAVLGELVAGVLLGNLLLINPSWNWFAPLQADHMEVSWAVIVDALARLGVILLLFEVGLESTVADMAKVGLSSFLVATVGVIAPFALGYFLSAFLITEIPADLLAKLPPGFSVTYIHIFVGATLCATSVGITARVFQDLGRLQSKEARIVLGAAVIDDVLGLIILAAVAGIIQAAETGSELSALALLKIIGMAFGFLLAALLIGQAVVPRFLRLTARLRTSGIMIISGLLLCFALAWAADAVGLATIVGAFAAGLILEEVHFRPFNEKIPMHDLVRPVTSIFVPVFFVLMGLRVRLETFADPSILLVAGAITVAAIIGKQVCGLAVVERGLDRVSVGIGMIPRGEVGLIFAGIGRALNVLDDALFSAIVIMVVVTTLVTPPALKITLGRSERRTGSA